MHLKHNQKTKIKQYFSETPGYVLDFTNRTFQEFFEDNFNIDILTEKYTNLGTSKFSRLSSFLAQSDYHSCIKLLRLLWIEKNIERDESLRLKQAYSDFSLDYERIELQSISNSLEDQQFEEFLSSLEEDKILHIEVSELQKITNTEVQEHVAKIYAKISNGDFSGAITNSYSLIESLLKLLLEAHKIEYKSTEGDIRKLYQALIPALNLDPSSDAINQSLKPILAGMKSIIAGIYEVSNKSGDRHQQAFKAADRHANLAANSTLTICQFLIESHEFRINQKTQ